MILKHVLAVHERKKLENRDDKRRYKFQCSICLILFKSENQVTKHVSRVHEGKKPEVILNKLSKYNEDQDWSPSTSKNEKKMSKVHENEKFKCSLCFKVLGAKATLKRHMSQLHEINKPIQCPQCPSRFGFKSEFNRHYENVHGGKGLENKRQKYNVQKEKKPFQCISCSTKFSFKIDLERHFAEAHEGEKIDCQDNSEIILPD